LYANGESNGAKVARKAVFNMGSNAIEGNTLTINETKVVLVGNTVRG